MFPGCVVMKNDSEHRPGVPDLLILFNDRWVMLEVKADATSPAQPNQQYFIDLFNEMSFAAFIYPQNEEDVLLALQHTFGSR